MKHHSLILVVSCGQEQMGLACHSRPLQPCPAARSLGSCKAEAIALHLPQYKGRSGLPIVSLVRSGPAQKSLVQESTYARTLARKAVQALYDSFLLSWAQRRAAD